MPNAIVLINVETGAEDEVIRELRRIEEVKEVYFVLGVYDVIIRIEAPTSQKLKDSITWKIRRLERIRSTQTLMII